MPEPADRAFGSYGYYCRSCQRVTVAAVSTDAFALLLTAGVQIQHGHPTPAASPTRPFTVADLIDFHRLLDTADWFTQLQALR